MTQFKRIVNVVPLTRVNLANTQIFSYVVPLELQDQIRPGQLVQVPFAGREVDAVTSSFEMHRLARETKRFKPLKKILRTMPVLTEKNLKLAEWLADYYLVPLGIVVKAMLPRIVKTPKDPQLVGHEKYNPHYILTEAQRHAVSQIVNSLGNESEFLLHGVTGSGKTEVYLQAIERVLGQDRQVILMVPEISLTPQAIERFARRFGIDEIALLHSQLKDTERAWMWEKIRDKEKRVIIGPRSAIFAPATDLGLIIIDEEHDTSFKQSDMHPKYHARSVAEKLSELWQCPLVLGDATPSMDSYFRAGQGGIKLLTLPHRIKADIGLPTVRTIDMRKEIRAGNFSIFSELLKYSILDALRKKEQIILFQNRRGTATFVMCRDCGTVLTCQNCESPLVWHGNESKLVCHHCGKQYQQPTTCAVCQGTRIKSFGAGTQRVETEVKKLLSEEIGEEHKVSIARLDSDVSSRKNQAEKIYQDWVAGKIDILVGTQIVSKAWDVSRVGLVGIVSADTLLHLPDFRSAERTFQTLTQVAGRAGRGDKHGLVIMQTYNPDNLALKAVEKHDYHRFFQTELKDRKQFAYPPFSRIVKLRIANPDRSKALETAEQVMGIIAKEAAGTIQPLGPAPAFIPKLRGRYQFNIILKLPLKMQPETMKVLQKLPRGVDIDVDPNSLL